jgi:hypothetical protein
LLWRELHLIRARRGACPSLASAQTVVLLPMGGDASLVAARGTEAVSRVRDDLESDGFTLLANEELAAALTAAHAEPCSDPTCAGPMLTALQASFAVGIALWPHDGALQVSVSLVGPDGVEVSATASGPEATVTQLARSALSQARANWTSRTGTPVRVVGSPEGASITIDHDPVGSIPYEAHLSPGVHHFVVSAEGHTAERRDVTIAAGSTTSEIRFELAVGSEAHHDEHAPNTSGSGPDIGWILGGTAVALGGAAALAEGIVTLADSEHCTAACGGPPSGRTVHVPNGDAGTALAIVGTVAVGLGIVAIVIGASVGTSSATRARITPTLDGVAISF